MPIYLYICECGNEVAHFKSISKRNDLPICDLCGIPMKRLFSTSVEIIMKKETGALVGDDKGNLKTIPGRFGD